MPPFRNLFPRRNVATNGVEPSQGENARPSADRTDSQRSGALSIKASKEEPVEYKMSGALQFHLQNLWKLSLMHFQWSMIAENTSQYDSIALPVSESCHGHPSLTYNSAFANGEEEFLASVN
jgi:hypothetical protein